MKSIKILALLVLSTLLNSCFQEPYPNRPLNTNQMISDFQQHLTDYDVHYAFTKYKETTLDYRAQKLGIGAGLLFKGPKIEGVHDGVIKAYKFTELNKLMKKIIRSGKLNNITYSALLQEYVASFRDAHNSLAFMPNNQKNASKIAYSGIFAVREGENAMVAEIHPLMSKSASFPVVPGDIITHVDGVKIRDYIDNEMARFRNLGKGEANMTFLMNGIFNRNSLQHELPAVGSDIVLTVEGKGNVTLPWVHRDYADFEYLLNQLKEDPFALKITDKVSGTSFELVMVEANGRPKNLLKALVGTNVAETDLDAPHLAENNFFALADAVTFSANADKYRERIQATGKEVLLNEGRYIPSDALFIEEAQTYPAYVTLRNKKMMGYIHIGTFSPQAQEEQVMAELNATLARFQALGVEDIVLDTLDNPGGSLSLVINVAQAFNNEKNKNIDMRFGLNENWMNDFLKMTQAIGMNSESELARRVYEELEADFNKGLKLSSKAYPIESFMPYSIQPNTGLRKKFNIILLQSEGNASCGDIHPYIMKRNGLAVLAGSDTMGAGGNVVKHLQTGNTHGEMRITESALVDEMGGFLENQGVKADVAMDTTFKTSGYADLIETSFDMLANRRSFAQLRTNAIKKYQKEVCNKLLKLK
ncbi:MAG: S41 family peptidase [Bacteriovoracaceae bacterium]|nr:S41 family peptidase [Bacteriovoracaceae bacterium]